MYFPYGFRPKTVLVIDIGTGQQVREVKSDKFGSLCGVAVDAAGACYVADCRFECVHVIDQQGSLVRSFGCGKLSEPFGIALHEGRVYVSEYDKVKVFRASDDQFECKLISGLNCAYNICIANDQLIVSECGANRVRVFTLKGEYVRTIGESGERDAQFSYPHGVHFDGKLLYVADCANHRVQVFTTDGQFVCKFGTERENIDGQFCYPHSITSDDEHIYVTDVSKRIQVFARPK